MLTSQQEQALDYFHRFAADWRAKAEGKHAAKKFNVIGARNACVLNVAKGMQELKNALDVGCGTGELVCDLAGMGVEVVGVDFAPDMIALCKEKAKQCKASSASFVCASIFNFDPAAHSFDLVSASGFIEYISEKELHRFLDHVHRMVRAGGTLVVGSRNRLFNMFSLNAFTEMERKNGCSEQLFEEAMVFTGVETGPLAMQSVLEKLKKHRPDLPRNSQHPMTEIGVAVRHQYTPAEVIHLLREHRFDVVNIVPIHTHGVPPAVKRAHPEVHTCIANLLQSLAWECPAIVPTSSTFMTIARAM